MKNLSIALKCTFMAFIVLFFIYLPKIYFEAPEPTAPDKPKSVPEKAFWVGGIDGGNFIVVRKVPNEKNLFLARIYNDYTGDLEYQGFLEHTGTKSIDGAFDDPGFYQGWDGDFLFLSSGDQLMRVTPQKAGSKTENNQSKTSSNQSAESDKP